MKFYRERNFIWMDHPLMNSIQILIQFVNIYRFWIYGFNFIAEYYRNHQHLQCMINRHVHPRRRHKLKIRISKFLNIQTVFCLFFDYVFNKQLIGFEWHEIYTDSDYDAMVGTSHSTGCE